MTARFGRNKRRRAREAIADRDDRIEKLGSALDMSRGLSKRQGEKIGALEDEIETAKKIAGRMSVLFPAGTMKLDGEAMEMVDVVVPGRLPDLGSMESYQLMRTIQSQRLDVLLSKIHPSALERAVHVSVTFGKGPACDIGYAISHSAIQSTPPDKLAQIVIKELGKAVSNRLKRVFA